MVDLKDLNQVDTGGLVDVPGNMTAQEDVDGTALILELPVGSCRFVGFQLVTSHRCLFRNSTTSDGKGLRHRNMGTTWNLRIDHCA